MAIKSQPKHNTPPGGGDVYSEYCKLATLNRECVVSHFHLMQTQVYEARCGIRDESSA